VALGRSQNKSNKGNINLTVNLSLDTIWCRLGFPIFRKVLIALDFVESLHNSIWLPKTRSESRNHSTTSALVIDWWCSVDLTKKANLCLRIEEHKQEQGRMQPICRWMIKLTSWGLTNRWTLTLFDDRLNLSKIQTLKWRWLQNKKELGAWKSPGHNSNGL
jgi:hypothetical protein